MIQNKKFSAYAAAFCVLCILYNFLGAMFTGGHLMIIREFIRAENGGWTEARLKLPFVLAAFAGVPAAYGCGTFFRKYGVRWTLIPGLGTAALGCICLSAANGLDIYGGASAGFYPLYVVSVILMFCAGILLMLASSALCVHWCLRRRGLALGMAAFGFSLFLIFRGSMTGLIAGRLGGDYRGFYLGTAAVLAVLAALSRLLLADWPEEAGLYPDGEGTAPVTEPEEDAPGLKIPEVLRDRRALALILAGGALGLTAAVCAITALLHPDTVHPVLLIILGLLSAYAFGRMDDTLGTVKSTLALTAFALLAVLGLWLTPGSGAARLFLTVGFGGLLGGLPVLRPCGTAFLYGRRRFTDADRVIVPLQLLIAAFSGITARAVLTGGHSAACTVLTAAVVLAVLCARSLRDTTDANADDRGY